MNYIQKIKPILKWIAVSLITVTIFYLIFRSVPIQDLVNVFLDANYTYVFLSLIPLCLSLVILTKRWQVILDAMGYQIPLKECFIIIMAAMPFSTITPSKSGDVVRAYYLKDKNIPVTKTVGGIISERIFDILILSVFSLGGMLYFGKYDFFYLGIIGFFICIVLITLMYYNVSLPTSKSWSERIENISLSMRMLIDNKNAFAAVVGYSLIVWILTVMQTVIFFYALQIDIPILVVFGLIPIAIFIGMLPVTLGGMGTRDAAIIVLFSSYALSSQLLGVGLLFSFFRYWLLAGIGLIFMKKLAK